MFNEINDLDFFTEFPGLQVPVIFIAGRYDYNTPSSLVEAYYQELKAPEKQFFWFEDSAHFPHFEDPAGSLRSCTRSISPSPKSDRAQWYHIACSKSGFS